MRIISYMRYSQYESQTLDASFKNMIVDNFASLQTQQKRQFSYFQSGKI